MNQTINATYVKQNEIVDNIFMLKKNKPKQISKTNNNHTAYIYEEDENENLYIHSEFTDNAFAIIGKEFCLNFLKSPKKVDMSYYYIGEDNMVNIYLYDIKKTFAGIEHIIHLIEQWHSSIDDAEYCIKKLENHVIASIKIGVITEDNDVNRREQELNSILYSEPIPDKLNSFMRSKRKAVTSTDFRKIKLLEGFDKGVVTINGKSYKYDIREFDNKNHHMYFKDGHLH